MQVFIFILLLLAITLLVLGLCYPLFVFADKKRYPGGLKLLVLIPIFALSYATFEIVYHNNNIYKEHFEEVTGLDFKDNGDFTYNEKWTSRLQKKDYTTISLLRINKSLFKELPEILEKKGMTDKPDTYESDPYLNSKLKYVLHLTDGLEIEREYRFQKADELNYYVAFLSDQQSLIIYVWHGK